MVSGTTDPRIGLTTTKGSKRSYLDASLLIACGLPRSIFESLLTFLWIVLSATLQDPEEEITLC